MLTVVVTFSSLYVFASLDSVCGTCVVCFFVLVDSIFSLFIESLESKSSARATLLVSNRERERTYFCV
ncbi:hypothetical protein [Helicobacter saguini]|uniref:hypothetical protein n=1 Tax=Helicobacter saguini TaxID=1548018 RepID=UPI001EE8DC8D|nr:hypothetical protein [Helicobacter saguini]